MTNKEKALKRERVRLRKSQNPQQFDYQRMDKLRSAKTEFWKMKKKGDVTEKTTTPKKDVKKPKPEKEKKKDKEPELEVIEEEPETEEKIDKELEDLYSYDDEEPDDEKSEEEEVKETSE